MAEKTFSINGIVVDRASRRPLPGLRVEAWDLDPDVHDLVGVERTDGQGRFRVTFDETYFQESGSERLPDVFFRVFRGTELLASTEKTVRTTPAEGESEVTIEINAPRPPQRGKDRIKASQVVNTVSFFRQSEFVAAASEVTDRTSAVAGVLGDVFREGLRGLGEGTVKPIRAPDSRSSEVIGQSPDAASQNLSKREIEVSAVKPYSPRAADLSVRTFSGMLTSIPRGSEVTLYEQDGRIRAYSIEKKKGETEAGPDAGGTPSDMQRRVNEIDEKVAELGGLRVEVERLKNAPAEGESELAKAITKVNDRDAVIADLRRALDQAQAESAKKDERIASLGRTVVDLERRHEQFTARVSLERIAKIEADLKKLRDQPPRG